MKAKSPRITTKYENPDSWVAPKWADTLSLKIQFDALAVQEGKNLYTANCIVCHGENGKGDGESGFGLSVPPGDFTATNFILESNGAIFWKITTGRHPMPAYEYNLTEIKRWQLVAFIRFLQAPANKKQKKGYWKN